MTTFAKNDFVEVYRKYTDNSNCTWISDMDLAVGNMGYVSTTYEGLNSCIIDFIGLSEEEKTFGVFDLSFPMESLRFASEIDTEPEPEPKIPFAQGDEVLIAQRCGESGYWVDSMDETVGMTGIIKDLGFNMACVTLPDGLHEWWYPLEALERVEKKEVLSSEEDKEWLYEDEDEAPFPFEPEGLSSASTVFVDPGAGDDRSVESTTEPTSPPLHSTITQLCEAVQELDELGFRVEVAISSREK